MRRLGFSISLAWAQFFFLSAFGGHLAARLSGDLALAGIPFFLVYAGSSLAAYPAGALIDRFGYRRVLVGGHLVTGFGTSIGAYGIRLGSFSVFVVGIGVASLGIGTTNLSRMAAADAASPALRGSAVARVMTGAAVGSLAGAVLVWIVAPYATDAVFVAWTLATLLPAAAAIVISGLRIPRHDAHVDDLGSDHPALRRWAGATFVFTHACMGTLMAVSGASLAHEGESPRAIAAAVGLHLAAMFAFSMLWGRLGDRKGRGSSLLVAATLLCAASASLIVAGTGVGFVVGLFFIGVAWSGSLVGSSAAVAAATRHASRGKALGGVEAFASAAGAASAGVAGLVLARFQGPGVAVFAIALALAALGAAARFWRVERREGSPAGGRARPHARD